MNFHWHHTSRGRGTLPFFCQRRVKSSGHPTQPPLIPLEGRVLPGTGGSPGSPYAALTAQLMGMVASTVRWGWKSCSTQGLHWYHGGCRGGPCYYWVMPKVQTSLWASSGTASVGTGRNLHYLVLGGGACPGLTCFLYWHHVRGGDSQREVPLYHWVVVTVRGTHLASSDTTQQGGWGAPSYRRAMM